MNPLVIFEKFLIIVHIAYKIVWHKSNNKLPF